VPLEERERVAIRKVGQDCQVASELLRDVVAVRINERHPVPGRRQHVTGSLECELRRVHGQLQHRTARERRENVVRGLEGWPFSIRIREAQLTDNDTPEDEAGDYRTGGAPQ